MRKVLMFVMAVMVITACGVEKKSSIYVGNKGGLALTLGPSASEKDGVAGFKVDISNTSGPVDSKYVVLETSHLPSGLLPDAGTAHDFANALFVLLPGNYHVLISPMKSETVPSTVCQTAETDIVVEEGETTTLALVSQCNDDDNGAAQILATLNNNPQLLDLTFNPSQFVSTCQNVDVTLTAQDPDADTLTYSWEILGAPPVTNTHSLDLEKNSYQYLSIPDNASLSITGNLVLEQWVNLESDLAEDEAYSLIRKGLTEGNYGYWFYIKKYFGGEKKIVLAISQDGTAYTGKSVTWNWNTGTWYHLSVVYNASAGTADFYVTGTQQGTQQTGLPTNIYDNSQPLLIGAYDASNNFFDGLIDDVRVWNITKTQTEINANKNVVINTATGLVGSWHLNNTLADSSGNGNHLTNNNSASFSTNVPFGGVTYAGSNVNNVYSFIGYAPGTYNLEATACDILNNCSSITTPIYVLGSPCQP